MTTEPTAGADAIDQASAAFWQPADLDAHVHGAAPLTADESFVIADLTDDEWEAFARPARMSVATVLLDTNLFTDWLRPRSTLLPLYGRHVLGRRIAIAQQTVAEVPVRGARR